MANVDFVKEFKGSALTLTGIQKNKSGKGQTGKVKYDGEEGVYFKGPACKANFKIKPGYGDTTLTDWLKMNLTMELNPDSQEQHELMKKLEELGDAVCQGVFLQKDKVRSAAFRIPFA